MAAMAHRGRNGPPWCIMVVTSTKFSPSGQPSARASKPQDQKVRDQKVRDQKVRDHMVRDQMVRDQKLTRDQSSEIEFAFASKHLDHVLLCQFWYPKAHP